MFGKVAHAIWSLGYTVKKILFSCCKVGVLRETPEGHVVLQRRRKRDRGHGSRVIEHLQARVAPDGQSAQVLQGARFTWKDAQIHSLVTPAAPWGLFD